MLKVPNLNASAMKLKIVIGTPKCSLAINPLISFNIIRFDLISSLRDQDRIDFLDFAACKVFFA